MDTRPSNHSDASSAPGSDSSYHLVVVGGGSAAFAAALEANDLGAEVTIVNDGLPIGGTCVNVGCVPSKNLIRAAEAVHRAAHPGFPGIVGLGRVEDFGAVIRQKEELVAELRQSKYLDVVSVRQGVRIVSGRARFVSPLAVEVGDELLRGTHYLIATGARPFLPPIEGLESVGCLTNESAFALDELPESLVVIGGGYVALEISQMFRRFGTRVTILQRSSRLLARESPDLTEALTGYLEAEGIEVVTDCDVRSARREGAEVVVGAVVEGKEQEFRARHVLAAAGRTPNTEGLGLEAVGVRVDERGFVVVDDTLRTDAPHVFGAGDVIGPPNFVYTAAYEGSLAARNAITGAATPRDYTALPWVLFTDPQVAGVGMDEREAAEKGLDFEASTLSLAHVPRSIAARDTRGFIHLVRERGTDLLLGARILAPEGSELLMEIALAIRHGVTVAEIARAFHPYLTLSEGVKLAAIAFDKDVAGLSCCAS